MVPSIGAYIDIKAKIKFRGKTEVHDYRFRCIDAGQYFRKIRTVIDPLT